MLRILLAALAGLLPAPQEPAAPPPADATPSWAREGARDEAPYLRRRRQKHGERGFLAQAEELRRRGTRAIGDGALRTGVAILEKAEALHAKVLDGSTWDPDGARFALSVAEACLAAERLDRAADAYARAVAWQDPTDDGPLAGAAALDELLAELGREAERDELVADARDAYVRALVKEMSLYGFGVPAPPLALETLDGEPFSLADAGGRAVLLDFWSPASDGWERHVARLDDLRRRFAERPEVRVLGVLVELGERPEGFRERLRALAPELEVLACGPDTERDWQVDRLPFAALVDRAGRYRTATPGDSPFTAEALALMLEELAREPAPEGGDG